MTLENLDIFTRYEKNITKLKILKANISLILNDLTDDDLKTELISILKHYMSTTRGKRVSDHLNLYRTLLSYAFNEVEEIENRKVIYKTLTKIDTYLKFSYCGEVIDQ
jgi:hypothetical protein